MGRPAEESLQLDMVSQLSDVTIGCWETSRGHRFIGWNDFLKYGGDQVTCNHDGVCTVADAGEPLSLGCAQWERDCGISSSLSRYPLVVMPSKVKALKDWAAHYHLCSRP